MRSRAPYLVTLVLALVVFSLSSSQLNAQSVEATAAKSDTSVASDSAKPAAENNDKEAPEKRKFRLRLGGISVGAGYSHFSGPYYYPYAYPYAFTPVGFYPGDWVAASFWYPLASSYPFYGPGAFAYGGGRGEVRLAADPKAAKVYIDGGYAGTAETLKNLWLDPGAYDLTVSAAGHEDFHQRLYVLSGKSLKITAKLNAETSKEEP